MNRPFFWVQEEVPDNFTMVKVSLREGLGHNFVVIFEKVFL